MSEVKAEISNKFTNAAIFLILCTMPHNMAHLLLNTAYHSFYEVMWFSICNFIGPLIRSVHMY